MKNKTLTIVFLLSILFLGIGNKAYATLSVDANVDVPVSCTATDTDSVTHEYPQGSSYLAICALQAALQNNSVSNVKFSNQYPSMGLFVTSFNDVEADPNSQYWGIYQNGNFANSGITTLPVSAGDVLVFKLNDFSDNSTGDQITINIQSLVAPVTQNVGGGGGGGQVNTPTFSIQNAMSYLSSVQGADGSFDMSDRYTDWVAIAIGAANETGVLRTKIIDYLNNHKDISSSVIDNERRSMALLSLGQNPYSWSGVNYIDNIVKSFNGTQLGDVDQDNDDIFGLLVLNKVGYTISDNEVSKTVSFVLSTQLSNGSWDNSIDMTAAAMQALSPFNYNSEVSEKISKASLYLQNTQESDGGWGNIFSSSWVAQAQNSMGVSWAKNGKTVADYLASQQLANGVVSPSSDTYATSSSIPGALGKPWSQIMQSVSKIITPVSSGVSIEEIKPEIKKDEVVVKKDDTTEKKPEIINEEVTQVKIKEVSKNQKTTVDTKNKIKINQKKEVINQIEKINKVNLTASAVKSNASDKIYIFMDNMFTSVVYVFKGFLSIFN